MSVFVDIVPGESPGTHAAPGPSQWRVRLTRAALPLLSVVVFIGVWQLAAASGIWNQTFVPYPSSVWHAFVEVSTELVIWLGIDEAPKITLLALAALPPAAVATTAAVVAAPVGLVEAARALGASRWQVTRDVVIPAALPETFTGVRLAVGMAYSSVVAAELFNGIPGVGGLVKDASNYNNTPVVLVGIFSIGISGLVIDAALRAVERRAVPWRGKI
ncbi:putative taurine ABC transporter permease protein [Mycobacteroides abscessus subsp. abscessus]|nr:putative taurine ABC transporter permease protein [Mycobacteroides abscessus subsp. abscessus]